MGKSREKSVTRREINRLHLEITEIRKSRTPRSPCRTPRIMLCSKREAIKVEVTANGKKLVMHIDTGAAVTILSEGTYKALWPQQGPPITPTKISYTGEPIQVKGRDATQWPEQGLACTGSEWVWPNPVRSRLDARDWHKIFHINNSPELAALLDKYK